MNNYSWVFMVLPASIFLALFYFYKNDPMFEFMGWTGLVFGAVMWWHNEKQIIERLTSKKKKLNK